jgi:tRNA1Val (adenine37-N6)-methyltransferase
MDDLMIQPDETLDDLFRGKLRILQKRDGYRLSMDPILLAHFAGSLRDTRVIDLGTGSGVIPLILGLRGDAREILGLEIQEDLADMARRSVRINGLEAKIRIVCGDYRRIEELFPSQSWDHVVSNPPHNPAGSGRTSPNPSRARAREEMAGSIEDLLRAARYLLGTKGRLWLTYPPTRLVPLILALRQEGFEPKALRMVHGRKELPARMALLEAVRGGREGLRILAPLILYRRATVYTEELEEIYRAD